MYPNQHNILSIVIGLFLLALPKAYSAQFSNLSRTVSVSLNYHSDCPKWKSYCKGTIKFEDGSIYEGEVSFGKPHGKGTMTWKDGKVYTGEFVEGVRKGYGDFFFEDGTKYQGEWNNNQMNGQGAYIWACGQEYVGSFKNDKMEGEGTILLETGASYSGSWKNGKADGYGSFINVDGSEYLGMNKEGVKHGEGMVIWVSGDTLTGHWANGELEGDGIFLFRNGDQLLTEWEEGYVFENAAYINLHNEIQEIDIKEFIYSKEIGSSEKRNLQLSYYSIGLEFKNNSKLAEAQDYLRLAKEVKDTPPNEFMMIAYYLDEIEKQLNSGWARRNNTED